VVDDDDRTDGGRDDVAAQVLAELLSGERRPVGAQSEHPERVVVAREGDRIDDVGMGARRVLEIQGQHRGAPDVPGIRSAAEYVEVATVVDEAQVAGRVPAVAEGEVARAPDVAGRHPGQPHLDDARCCDRPRLAGGRDDADLDPGTWPPGGAQQLGVLKTVVRRRENAHHADFAGAVGVYEDWPEPAEQPATEARRCGGADVADPAQRREIRVGQGRVVRELREQRLHQAELRDPLGLDHAQELGRIETVPQRDRPAPEQGLSDEHLRHVGESAAGQQLSLRI
jgi:hypothetical protein